MAGKTFNDLELAARVRSLALGQIEDVLNGKKYKSDTVFHKALLLKLSGTVLPRLNEVSGVDGGSLRIVTIPQEVVSTFGLHAETNPKTSGSNTKQEQV